MEDREWQWRHEWNNGILASRHCTSRQADATVATRRQRRHVQEDESRDEYIEKIKKLGGKIIVPKQEVPQVGWTAVATDPEGNHFAILQPMNP